MRTPVGLQAAGKESAAKVSLVYHKAAAYGSVIARPSSQAGKAERSSSWPTCTVMDSMAGWATRSKPTDGPAPPRTSQLRALSELLQLALGVRPEFPARVQLQDAAEIFGCLLQLA